MRVNSKRGRSSVECFMDDDTNRGGIINSAATLHVLVGMYFTCRFDGSVLVGCCVW